MIPQEVSQGVMDSISHITVVEMEADSGYRHREVMPEAEVSAYIAKRVGYGDSVSDVDCAMSCPCSKLRFPELVA